MTFNTRFMEISLIFNRLFKIPSEIQEKIIMYSLCNHIPKVLPIREIHYAYQVNSNTYPGADVPGPDTQEIGLRVGQFGWVRPRGRFRFICDMDVGRKISIEKAISTTITEGGKGWGRKKEHKEMKDILTALYYTTTERSIRPDIIRTHDFNWTALRRITKNLVVRKGWPTAKDRSRRSSFWEPDGLHTSYGEYKQNGIGVD